MNNCLKLLLMAAVCAGLTSCGKLGFTGHLQHMIGNWAQVQLPPNCVPKQIAAEENSGVAILCEDGRVFH